MQPAMTEHAAIRQQQRGISDLEIELILMYGRDSHHGDGCVFTKIDSKGFKKLQRDLKRVCQRLERLKSEFIVHDDGRSIVTVGHKYRKINQR